MSAAVLRFFQARFEPLGVPCTFGDGYGRPTSDGLTYHVSTAS